MTPVHRRHHHGELTFRSVYAFSENFMLPLSHDEVVHGKRSLLEKMPGDDWQRFANLRLLYGYQFGQPGKKLLFMGDELAERREWDHEGGLDWGLLESPAHAGMLPLGGRSQPALPPAARPARPRHRTGRVQPGPSPTRPRPACSAFCGCRPTDRRSWSICNFTPVPRSNVLVGVPDGGFWRELLNSDAVLYGGSGWGNLGGIEAQPVPAHGLPWTLTLTIPPLGCLFFGLG